jgi:hypothetical protein
MLQVESTGKRERERFKVASLQMSCLNPSEVWITSCTCVCACVVILCEILMIALVLIKIFTEFPALDVAEAVLMIQSDK